MKTVQGVGILNVVLGLIAVYLPIKFYSFASNLFTADVSPPFSLGAIKLLTLFLFLPSLVLVVNGIALITLGTKLERVPEYKAFSESGEYMGRLKGVEMAEGEVERFNVGEGEEEKEVLPGERLVAMDDVVIVKKPMVDIGGVRHEFVGKEVYTELGEYMGKVDSVVLDKQGEVIEFRAMRGDKKKVIKSEDVDSHDGVIIVKSNA